MKMINKQRVHRIKNLLYAFIILIMFLPLILMSILSFQMFGAIKNLNAKVDSLSKFATSQTAAASSSPDSSAPDSGYVIEPEDQTSKPEDTGNRATEQSGTETAPDQSDKLAVDAPELNNEKLTAPANGLAGSGVQGGDKLSPADGGSELGGGAPLDQSGDGYLAAAGAGTDATGGAGSTDGNDATGSGSVTGADKTGAGNSSGSKTAEELAGNPQMGYAEEAPSYDYTINPSTGS